MPLENKENNSTIETNFDQYGNKAVKEVDEETVTRENDISFTRDPTTSLLSGNVEYSYGIKN